MKSVCAILFVFSSITYGQTTSRPVLYQSRSSFYQSTPHGSIAFLPYSIRDGDAKGMTTFKAMQDNGYYELPSKTNYGFVINICDTANKTPSFIALTIIQILPRQANNGGVTLQRSENWELIESPATTAPAMEYFLSQITASMEDLMKLNLSCASLVEFNQALEQRTLHKVLWHAKPLGGSTSSWEARRNIFGNIAAEGLNNSLRRWFSELPEDLVLRISTRLVRFTPSDRTIPGAPFDFYFRASGAKKVAILTVCPDYPAYNQSVFLLLR